MKTGKAIKSNYPIALPDFDCKTLAGDVVKDSEKPNSVWLEGVWVF